MRRAALLAFGAATLLWGSALADEVSSIAVLPYLTVGVSDGDAAAISEVLAREVAARTGAKVKAGAQLKEKLPPLPDGCPTQRQCVSEVATTLEVERLLFAAYLEGEGSIEVTLSFVGGGEERQARITLGRDPTTWNDALRAGLVPVLPQADREVKPIYKRLWFWGGVGGVVVTVAGFFLLQPTFGNIP